MPPCFMKTTFGESPGNSSISVDDGSADGIFCSTIHSADFGFPWNVVSVRRNIDALQETHTRKEISPEVVMYALRRYYASLLLGAQPPPPTTPGNWAEIKQRIESSDHIQSVSDARKSAAMFIRDLVGDNREELLAQDAPYCRYNKNIRLTDPVSREGILLIQGRVEAQIAKYCFDIARAETHLFDYQKAEEQLTTLVSEIVLNGLQEQQREFRTAIQGKIIPSLRQYSFPHLQRVLIDVLIPKIHNHKEEPQQVTQRVEESARLIALVLEEELAHLEE